MKQLLCCALLLTAFFACRPELGVNQDFDIPQEKALQSSQDIENALQSGYAYLRSQHCYGGSWMLWPEIMTDNVIHNPNSSYPTPELQIYNRNLLPTDTMIALSWATAYKAIGISNAVLDAISKGNIIDSDYNINKNRFLGEAHFIRAITLFELVRFFAPQYSPENIGLPAIPVPTENYKTVTYLPRKTVGEVYDQILNDLRLSAAYFKADNIGTTPYTPATLFRIGAGFEIFNRANYHIALGFRSRVLMQTGETQNLEEAISHINEILENRTNLTFNTDSFDTRPVSDPLKYYPNPYPLYGSDQSSIKFMFVNNSARGVPFTIDARKLYEHIFSIMNFRNDDPATNTSRYFASRFSYDSRQTFFNVPPPYASFFGVPNLLFRRPTDKRNRSFFENNQFTRIVINGRPRPSCNKYNNEIVNIPVIRSADLLLSRAEANARLGRNKQAIYDLLFVKYRSAVASRDTVEQYYLWEGSGQNPGFLLNEIVRERQREMYLEGDRLHTLRRLRIDIPDAERGTGLPWNSSSLIFPIPLVETKSNPKLR